MRDSYERKKAEALAAHAAASRLEAEAAALLGDQEQAQHYLQMAGQWEELAFAYQTATDRP